jgi:3-phosphoshikimate 1-carboxyvinyltransferase
MIEVIPVKSLNAEITVPGSKYIGNRVLVICSLAEGNSTIRNLPDNDDINNAIKALQQFGVEIAKHDGIVSVKGTGGKLKLKGEEINVGESGTLLRFMIGFASLADSKVRITGSKRIQERPVLELVKSLRELGVGCNALNKECPPVVIEGGSLKGGKTRIKGNISSQFISSLLLAAPYAKNDVEIVVENLVSQKYVDMTISLMEKFGVKVGREGYERFLVKAGQRYAASDFKVPADWSSANYFFAAAAIVPGKVKIKGLDMESEHGEAGFVELLGKMGCKVRKGNGWVEVEGKEGLEGIKADMSEMPDAVQTLAAVAAFSKGATRISNISHLKYKESDRIMDTCAELRKVGLDVSAGDGELTIKGGEGRDIAPAVIEPHNDHRMAMSFGIIGLKAKGIKIKNSECVNKSFPSFWEKLREIGAEIRNV